jgi:hypothetical protein
VFGCSSLLPAILFSEDAKFFEQAKVLMLTSVQEALQQEPVDPKIAYRCIVVLGTLVYQDANATELARDLDLLDVVNAVSRTLEKDEQTQKVTLEFRQAIKGGVRK